MLIGGLIALLSLLLGSETKPFLIPEGEKAVKKVIVDKNTRKELKVIFQSIEKKEKKYKKTRKKYLKDLDKFSKIKSVDNDELVALGKHIQKVNNETNDFMIKARISIGKHITDDEWKKIIEHAKKEFDKADKKYEKVYPKLEKALRKLSARITKELDNKEAAEMINIRLAGFAELTLKNAKKLNSYNVFENQVFANIHSTEEELKVVSLEMLELRTEVTD